MLTFSQEGFKSYLGVVPTLTNWSADGKECSIILDQNPLSTWVELPENHSRLYYSNLICGVIRGCLEMVGHLMSSLDLTVRRCR